MLLITLSLTMACTEEKMGLMPDFNLIDVNPNSDFFEESVSPRDHMGKVSAWYFGHAT